MQGYYNNIIFSAGLRDVSFFKRRGEGSLKILLGGGHIFSEPKKGDHIFFQSLISNIFLKRVCNISNQSASCTTEPLFVSLSNTDLQIFCLIHKPHSSKLKDQELNCLESENKYCCHLPEPFTAYI